MKKETGKDWDPNDPGLNKDPHPGNYSTGKEDQENADPEIRHSEEEREAPEPDKEEKNKETEESKNLHTSEPDKIDPVKNDPMHQFPKEN